MVQKSDESYAKVEPEAKEPEEDEELSFEKEMTEDESDYDEQERDYGQPSGLITGQRPSPFAVWNNVQESSHRKE